MIRQQGLRWLADVDINGQRTRKTFLTQAEAEAFEKYHREQNNTVKKLPELARDLWGGTKDERNVLRIADELVGLLGEKTPFNSIDDALIIDVSNKLKRKNNKPSTINSKLVRLSKLLKRAKVMGYMSSELPNIEINKLKGGRIRFLSDEEEATVIKHLEPHHQQLFKFLLHTGMRIGEALGLFWRDIDYTHALATLWDTKSGKPRTVPLNKTAMSAVEWFAAAPQSHTVFGMCSYIGFYQDFKRAKVKAGMAKDKDVSPHVLRHTFASRLVQRGVPLPRLQELLGHHSITMTMKYAHLAKSDLHAAVSVLEA